MGLISNLVLFKTTDFDFPQFFLNYCKEQDVDVFYHEDDWWYQNISVTIALPVRYKDDLADVIVAYSPHPDDLLQALPSFIIDDEFLAKFDRDTWEDATKEILDQVNRYKDVNVNGEEWEKYFSENNFLIAAHIWVFHHFSSWLLFFYLYQHKLLYCLFQPSKFL